LWGCDFNKLNVARPLNSYGNGFTVEMVVITTLFV